MEIPWMCASCRHENMVDLEQLLERTVDKMMAVQGFICEECEVWEAISYRTLSLLEMERKLSRYRPGQNQFEYIFKKLIRKQTGLNERGETNGALKHPYMAIPRPLG